MFIRNGTPKPRDPFGRIVEDEPFAPSSFQTALSSSLGRLDQAVGRNQPNTRKDVARVESLMERNGAFDTMRTAGPTGFFSLGLDDAIKGFQEEKGLKKDGLIYPKGETIGALVRFSSADGDSGDSGDGDAEEAPSEVEGPPEPPPVPEHKPEPPADPEEPEKPEDDEQNCSELESELAVAQGILEEMEGKLYEAASALSETESELEVLYSRIELLDDANEEIEKEELEPNIPEKKIPGTDIPDRGIPEQGYPNSPNYDPHRPPPQKNPDPHFDRLPPLNIDPGMEIPELQRPVYEQIV